MNNFSIGEISKLHNVSVQTLRYYDKIGLLKPKIIDEKSNYRYYSIEQFLQLDIIKYCKGIGLPLEQIKNIMGTNISTKELFEMIKVQKKIIEDRLKEMNDIKNYLDRINSKLASIIENENNKVFIKYNRERKYISFAYASKDSDEIEINYRKAVLNIEKFGENLRYDLAASAVYDDKRDKILYKNIMLTTNEKSPLNNDNIITLPEGEYVTIYFEGKWFESKKYYNKIIKYINENNIKVRGDFHELYIFPKLDENNEEKTLTQLEILKV
ncbi:MerR family transcriptional regulator [Clostridium felsineum]|uniref:MerR family transcriptional regulator n=1 Tax=Clostridium felsineum TaxID=36839 RepID=UPI00214DD847|nr:MerR family transcriptional regulator [Clostridium felsineum]MCR3761527.1 MerR family transcriptional regulator [Clostridium felsineum]